MDRQPVLDGERLLLRPLRSDDFETIFAIARDPLVWAMHPQHDRWQEEVFRAFFASALAGGGAIAVIDKATDEVIGSSRWERFDRSRGGSVEIGWTFLARSHWGGVINRELKRMMLLHAFEWVERAIFRVSQDNLRSRRAMEKIGARLTENATVEATASGMVRHVIYEITRKEFERGPLMSGATGSTLEGSASA